MNTEAPNIEEERDLDAIYNIDDMSKMSFTPLLGNSIKEKDKRIFNDGKMGIRDEVMQQTLKT